MPGGGDGQRGLACCSPWGRKESDTTEWLNWTELKVKKVFRCFPILLSQFRAASYIELIFSMLRRESIWIVNCPSTTDWNVGRFPIAIFKSNVPIFFVLFRLSVLILGLLSIPSKRHTVLLLQWVSISCRASLSSSIIFFRRPGSQDTLSVQFSHSVVSDSLWPRGLKHTTPPWPSPLYIHI